MRNLIFSSLMLLASAKDTPKSGGASATGTPARSPDPAPTHPNMAAGAAAPSTNEVENEGVEMLRKISPATVIGQFKKPKKDDGTAYAEDEKWPDTPLYVVMGVTHGVRTGTGDNGPWVAFLGAFEAVRFKDSKRFQGGQCFLPKAVEDVMAATLNATKRAEAANGGSAAIEFGIEVGIKWSPLQVGYEYTVKNLVKTQGTDPLALLRQKIRPALPAPMQAALPVPSMPAQALPGAARP